MWSGRLPHGRAAGCHGEGKSVAKRETIIGLTTAAQLERVQVEEGNTDDGHGLLADGPALGRGICGGERGGRDAARALESGRRPTHDRAKGESLGQTVAGGG